MGCSSASMDFRANESMTSPTLPTTTIYSLPPELIEHIISVAYVIEPTTPHGRQERLQFLLATSLVSRVWTPFAQEKLWDSVALDKRTIDGFLAAGPGLHPVRSLSLQLYRANHRSTEAILRAVRGIHEFTLVHGIIETVWLCGENFKGLKSLTLKNTEVVSSMITSLPFELTFLKLDCRFKSPSTELLDALSRQSSINSLTLAAYYFDPTSLLQRLSSLVPHLVTLQLSTGDTYGGAVDAFLRRCAQLKHLTMYTDQMESINNVSIPLESWTISALEENDLETVLDILESKPVALSKLLCLRVLKFSQEGTDEASLRVAKSWDRWIDVEEECQRRKIELVVEHPR